MTFSSRLKALSVLIVVVSCMKPTPTASVITLDKNTLTAKASATAKIQLADGLKISLWAADTLSPDPVSLDIDDKGRMYITRTNRQKHSEFDIRGHRDWMIASIGLKTVEERRAFLRSTFAPEKSIENSYLVDLNKDGSHDWRDLAVEQDEIWRIEDKDKDGVAETSTRVFEGPNEEITDVAGGLLVRKNDAFWPSGPDMWRLQDKNKDGIYETKTSISHGYAVHIGFGGHGMSGAVQGPDGKIYWQIGDIGANITDLAGNKHEYPNEGILVRSNPDGSDFEVVAHGIRNCHEFVFDDYGNILSSDNDGDHAGESERLVHIVEGGDFGWRSNWQYGKYTDPRNNNYNVWMREKLSKPRWDGQAAYIIPPIQNYHNGPTGMVFNPGTALGQDWLRKFFLVEFVGSPGGSHIWSFGLKPTGASFVLDGDQKLTTGILPTGIRFGIDGALYAADWLNGWDTKNFGKIWKIDVTDTKNDLEAQRAKTKTLMLADFGKKKDTELAELLFYPDMRIRQKAQFELVDRKSGLAVFKKESLNANQFARIHSIWGIGQLSNNKNTVAAALIPLLKHSDEETIVQAIKTLGDVKYKTAGDALIPFLSHQNPRIQFFAAQSLGRLAHQTATKQLLSQIEANADKDLMIRHAAVLALSRIGDRQPIYALSTSNNKALKTAAILVLRKWKDPQVAAYLKDADEYLATEAARAINDELSIPEALPALAQTLSQTTFKDEALIRRALNAAQRVGSSEMLDLVISYAERTDIAEDLKAEALACVATWASPSLVDRVDGRYRGEIKRDAAMVNAKMKKSIQLFLTSKNPGILVAAVKLLGELGINDYNEQIAAILNKTDHHPLKSAAIASLATLKYTDIQTVVKKGLEDANKEVRTAAIGQITKLTIDKNQLGTLTEPIFEKGSLGEQQQLIKVLSEMPIDNTRVVYESLIDRMAVSKLDNRLLLDLTESIENTKNEDLNAKLKALKATGTATDAFSEALFGGNRNIGRDIFYNNQAAQCVRCHAIGNDGGGVVGPNLSKIGSNLKREQLLQALIEPSARLAPGYGNVNLILSDGQEVGGLLIHETNDELVLKTNEAEPLKIAKSRIKTREDAMSSMTPMADLLSKREIRDLVEFLTSLK